MDTTPITKVTNSDVIIIYYEQLVRFITICQNHVQEINIKLK